MVTADLHPVTAKSQDPKNTVVVLVVTPDDEAYRRIGSIFQHSNWSLRRARDEGEALQYLRRNVVPVLITEETVDGIGWRELHQKATEFHRPPPRWIVASRLADDPLWQEVLQLGAYNVLPMPFDPREVYWVVSNAWLDWKAESSRRRRAAAG